MGVPLHGMQPMTTHEFEQARRAHARELLAAGLDESWMVQTYDTVYSSWCEVLRLFRNNAHPERALVLIASYSHCGTIRTTDLVPVADVLQAQPRGAEMASRMCFREGCLVDGEMVAWTQPLTGDSWITNAQPQQLGTLEYELGAEDLADRPR